VESGAGEAAGHPDQLGGTAEGFRARQLVTAMVETTCPSTNTLMNTVFPMRPATTIKPPIKIALTSTLAELALPMEAAIPSLPTPSSRLEITVALPELLKCKQRSTLVDPSLAGSMLLLD